MFVIEELDPLPGRNPEGQGHQDRRREGSRPRLRRDRPWSRGPRPGCRRRPRRQLRPVRPTYARGRRPAGPTTRVCPGCGHRPVFAVLKKLRVFVIGDIGCYGLAALPPYDAMDTLIDMGAGISMAHGINKVIAPAERVVGVVGDSTFFHSGINSLMDVAYNKGNILALILDNRTTAMTGGQETAGSGKTLLREPSAVADIPGLCRDMGLERVTTIDPYDLEEVERVLREELAYAGPSVVIAKAPCVLQFKIKRVPYHIDADLCIGCKRCLQAGCMALNLLEDENGDSKVEYVADQCAGCGVCSQLCKEDAILPPAPGETGLKGAYAKEAS